MFLSKVWYQLKKSNFRYNYFYHSSISSEAEFRWDEPENPDDPDEPEKPDEPENPDDDVFLSEKFSMIIISSEEHITPDSCRILSSSNSDSFSNPEHCSSFGFSDPAVIGSSKWMVSQAAKLSDRLGMREDVFCPLLGFGLGFLNDDDLPGNWFEIGRDEEMEAGRGIIIDDPIDADPVIHEWDKISSNPILFPGLILRQLKNKIKLFRFLRNPMEDI